MQTPLNTDAVLDSMRRQMERMAELLDQVTKNLERSTKGERLVIEENPFSQGAQEATTSVNEYQRLLDMIQEGYDEAREDYEQAAAAAAMELEGTMTIPNVEPISSTDPAAAASQLGSASVATHAHPNLQGPPGAGSTQAQHDKKFSKGTRNFRRKALYAACSFLDQLEAKDNLASATIVRDEILTVNVKNVLTRLTKDMMSGGLSKPKKRNLSSLVYANMMKFQDVAYDRQDLLRIDILNGIFTHFKGRDKAGEEEEEEEEEEGGL